MLKSNYMILKKLDDLTTYLNEGFSKKGNGYYVYKGVNKNQTLRDMCSHFSLFLGDVANKVNQNEVILDDNTVMLLLQLTEEVKQWYDL